MPAFNTRRENWTIRPANIGDVDPIAELVSNAGLPLDGLNDLQASQIVAESDGVIIGTASLELYETAALLRSVAVATSHRSLGLGTELINNAVLVAKSMGVSRIYLLTETAPEYFPRFGFRVVSRSLVPDAVKSSVEFTTACPASAIAMELDLD